MVSVISLNQWWMDTWSQLSCWLRISHVSQLCSFIMSLKSSHPPWVQARDSMRSKNLKMRSLLTQTPNLLKCLGTGYNPQRDSGFNRSNLRTGSRPFNCLTGRKKLEQGPVVVIENKMALIRGDSSVLMKILARWSQRVDLWLSKQQSLPAPSFAVSAGPASLS